MLDVDIASPHGSGTGCSWSAAGYPRPKIDDEVDEWTGKTVKITIDGSDDYQLDGDVAGVAPGWWRRSCWPY